MNCAIMPFRDTTMKHLMIDQKSPLRYNPKVEKNLSVSVKDLMASILRYEAERRLNLNQIHDHTWLEKALPCPSDELPETPSATTLAQRRHTT